MLSRRFFANRATFATCARQVGRTLRRRSPHTSAVAAWRLRRESQLIAACPCDSTPCGAAGSTRSALRRRCLPMSGLVDAARRAAARVLVRSTPHRTGAGFPPFARLADPSAASRGGGNSLPGGSRLRYRSGPCPVPVPVSSRDGRIVRRSYSGERRVRRPPRSGGRIRSRRPLIQPFSAHRFRRFIRGRAASSC